MSVVITMTADETRLARALAKVIKAQKEFESRIASRKPPRKKRRRK